ncbi:hypothetical protein ABKW02_24275, partial [Enterobacter cloacae]|uniref:hypothetical protein n=1 Tax=Enterobacter cloacae TaxID=550 RepID=UPI0032AE980D
GILKVELTSGNAFNFASSVGNLFTGTLEMGSGTFSLDGDNTAGDMIPADLRIIQARDLFVAQASLTKRGIRLLLTEVYPGKPVIPYEESTKSG